MNVNVVFSVNAIQLIKVLFKMSINNFQTCVHFLAMKLILKKGHIKET